MSDIVKHYILGQLKKLVEDIENDRSFPISIKIDRRYPQREELFIEYSFIREVDKKLCFKN